MLCSPNCSYLALLKLNVHSSDFFSSILIACGILLRPILGGLTALYPPDKDANEKQ